MFNPPNKKPLPNLWAVMSRDEKGNEGILAGFIAPFGMVPLVTGDPKVLKHFEQVARAQLGEIADDGMQVFIAQYGRTSERDLAQ